jgi:hypothetical protein
MSATTNADLPDFLRTADSFLGHLRDQFEAEDSQGKGDAFLSFCMQSLTYV